MREVATSPEAALWLLLPALPISLWVAWSDMARLRIPNPAVAALTVGFFAIGPIALGWSDYFWRWTHLPVVLAAGVALYAGRLVGAGDAKFAAAAAPYVALPDLRAVLLLFAAVLLAAFAAHRLAMHSPLRALSPDWASWSSGRRFPMGLALGGTLVGYLALAAAR